MSNVSVFSFGKSKVRTVVADGEVWFVGADVCTCLDVGNTSQALSRLDDDEKGICLTDTLGGEQYMTTINESGLYSLVLSSRKPEAKAFKKWVTSEVLPSIRKVLTVLKSIDYSGDLGLAYVRDGDILTTSMIIAEETGKKHSNVTRDIDDEIDNLLELGLLKIEHISSMKKEIVYIDSQNRQQKGYEINEQLTMMILARYSVEFRYKLTEAFIGMRNTILSMHKARGLEQVMPQDNRNRQFVYVIGDPVKNLVKIGVAQDVNKRLKQLQTGNSTELEVLWVSCVCSNAYKVESIAHKKFEEHKILNEWFLVSVSEVVNFLEIQEYNLKSDFKIGLY